MKKPHVVVLHFTCIILIIELNFTIAFLLISKIWDGRFVGKMGRTWGDGGQWEILKNGGILVMGDDFEMGGAGYPFTNYEYVLSLYALLKTFALFRRELSYIILSKMESFLDFD